MTLASPALTIDDSEALPGLPFAPPMPTVPVRAIVEVDLSDGVRYQQECGHRTWWAGLPDRTPKVGQLHSCIACWASLLDAESLLPAGATPVALPTHADPETPADLLANFKRCTTCNEVLPITEFYVLGRGGTAAHCKSCNALKRRAYNRANTSKNSAYRRNYVLARPEWRREQQRLAYAKNPEAAKARVSRWQQANRERHRAVQSASQKVKFALRRGELVRPNRCEQCGASGRIEAAHHDYSQAFDVRWLCQPCHRQWDKEQPKTLTAPEHPTPADLLKDFNGLRRWLASKNATDDVGEAQTSGYCPIATYLRDSGVDEPQVGPDVVGWNVDPSEPFDEAAPRAPLPKWAQKFVDLVDRQGACRPIRASLAMTLLYQAVRESIGR